MRTSTPELLLEAILEGYRQAAAGHDHLERTSMILSTTTPRAAHPRAWSRIRWTSSCAGR